LPFRPNGEKSFDDNYFILMVDATRERKETTAILSNVTFWHIQYLWLSNLQGLS